MSSQVLGRSIAYMSGTLAPTAVSLAITPVIVRLLGPQSYGVVALSATLLQFGIVVLTFGLAASITRQAIIDDSGTGGAVGTVISGAVLGLLAFSIVAMLLPFWGPLLLPGHESGVLIFPLLSSFGLASLQDAQSLLRAENKVASFVLLGVSASVLAPAVGVATMLIAGRTAGFYLLGQSSIHVIIGVIAVLWCVRLRRPTFDLKVFWASLRIGLPTVPHQIAVSSMTLVLVSLAAHTAGLSAAGALQLGLLVGSAPMLFLGALNNVWAPLIYRTSDEDRQGILRSTFRIIMMAVVALTTGFTVLGPYVAGMIAGPAAERFPVFQIAVIASLGTALMAAYLANIHMVFISGRTLALALTTPAAATLSVLVAAASYLMGGAIDLRTLAMGIPLFQLAQLMVSGVLRSRRSAVSVKARPVLPEILVITVTSMSAYFVGDRPYLIGLLALVVVSPLLWLRRDLISPLRLRSRQNVG
jgi:O-antigen/teichoic acid export membrane protein